MDHAQKVVTNLVWAFSMILLIGFYLKDSECIKNSKACELEIYQLEVEDLKNKKEIDKYIKNFKRSLKHEKVC